MRVRVVEYPASLQNSGSVDLRCTHLASSLTTITPSHHRPSTAWHHGRINTSSFVIYHAPRVKCQSSSRNSIPKPCSILEKHATHRAARNHPEQRAPLRRGVHPTGKRTIRK